MSLLMARPIQRKDLELMQTWLDAGKVVPVVERTYPLSDTAAVISYFESGHAQGKIVIAI
jgi:NADPH:quinone reductase-like Zn-dependent oxidoreductase